MESQIVPGYSREEISNLQHEDSDLKLLFSWLESDEISDDEFALAPPATKKFLAMQISVTIENEFVLRLGIQE